MQLLFPLILDLINMRFSRERIIVPLDRQFLVYPRGAGVDEGEECPGVVYPGSCNMLIEKFNKFNVFYPGQWGR